jgi:hypothetical protein
MSGDRIPVGARFSEPVQTGTGAHPASSTIGTGSSPGVKSGRGVTLTPHPLLVPLVIKELSYTSTPFMGRTACTEPQCLYEGALYLYLTYHLSACLTGKFISTLLVVLVLTLQSRFCILRACTFYPANLQATRWQCFRTLCIHVKSLELLKALGELY